MASPAVLFVISAANSLTLERDESMRTGFWVSEFITPYDDLIAAGFSVEVATPGGFRPCPDPASLGTADKSIEYLSRLESIPGYISPRNLNDLDDSFIATILGVVIPGGYAPMADLVASPSLGRVLRSLHASGRPIAAICHAPAALLAVREPGKSWLFEGFRIAVFTNSEENEWLGERRHLLPWTAEDALTAAGAVCRPAPNWTSNVIRDRHLLTGQNSASCLEFSRQLLVMLRLERHALASYDPT
jgi:putative intracellular protease/amidase